MSYRRYQIIDHSSPSFPLFSPPLFSYEESTTTSIFPSKTLLNPFLPFPSPLISHEEILDFGAPFDPFFDSLTDVVQIQTRTTPFGSHRQLVRRVDSSEFYLRELSHRVNSLESKFDRLLELKRERTKRLSEVDRKYTWTAEIKDRVLERKYKWTAEIEGDDEKKGKTGERKYQWVTEFKDRDEDGEKKTYTWKATIGGENKKEKKEEKKKEKKGSCSSSARVVEIEEPSHHGAVVLRQAFAKRAVAAKDKGKKKELSPQDAAAAIQLTFRAYLIRRSKALRALRELAVAKTKLKELRALFHNFSYRSRIARDAEERQKFSEKIIVLLLTVDAIEGVDLMVRAAKRSMVDELEAMLDVVDPQPTGRSLSMRRRTFDMPTGGIQKEIAEGVAQVVQMIEEQDGAFEACL